MEMRENTESGKILCEFTISNSFHIIQSHSICNLKSLIIPASKAMQMCLFFVFFPVLNPVVHAHKHCLKSSKPLD